MHLNHPFGSWAEAGSSSFAQPTLGALPYLSDASNFTTFYFTSFNPNVLNCTVVGPQAQISHRIVTDNHMPGYTVIKNGEGKNVALVEWQSHPMIEIRGIVSKQHVKSWLGLTNDRSSRVMTVRGMQYIWAPQDKSINLYAGGPRNPTLLARITRANGAISLDMTPTAMQLDLLDSAVAAALLLQCGRNID